VAVPSKAQRSRRTSRRTSGAFSPRSPAQEGAPCFSRGRSASALRQNLPVRPTFLPTLCFQGSAPARRALNKNSRRYVPHTSPPKPSPVPSDPPPAGIPSRAQQSQGTSQGTLGLSAPEVRPGRSPLLQQGLLSARLKTQAPAKRAAANSVQGRSRAKEQPLQRSAKTFACVQLSSRPLWFLRAPSESPRQGELSVSKPPRNAL
jgi:hypothetical protein